MQIIHRIVRNAVHVDEVAVFANGDEEKGRRPDWVAFGPSLETSRTSIYARCPLRPLPGILLQSCANICKAWLAQSYMGIRPVGRRPLHALAVGPPRPWKSLTFQPRSPSAPQRVSAGQCCEFGWPTCRPRQWGTVLTEAWCSESFLVTLAVIPCDVG